MTGEGLRWLARYGVGLILPNGPSRILTVIESTLEASQTALDRNPDIDPAVIRAQLAKPALEAARAILTAKIEVEAWHARIDLSEHVKRLPGARRLSDMLMIEAHASAAYWREFADVGLREAKGGNLPRSWLRFANRQKGAGFLGSKNANHPINAMLNYAYTVEAGRMARALAARGLALQIGFLHSDKKGRNSLVWDAIEPIRPKINARVFDYIKSREFARSDFIPCGPAVFRLNREIIAELLADAILPEIEIADAADFMLRIIDPRLFKPDLRRMKRKA
jgi:CRISPR-associated endonuclease Cas1